MLPFPILWAFLHCIKEKLVQKIKLISFNLLKPPLNLLCYYTDHFSQAFFPFWHILFDFEIFTFPNSWREKARDARAGWLLSWE